MNNPSNIKFANFIVGARMQYGLFYMHRCEQSGGQSGTHSPAHQTAHTDACKTYRTAYTNVPVRMNLRGSKNVGDNKN